MCVCVCVCECVRCGLVCEKSLHGVERSHWRGGRGGVCVCVNVWGEERRGRKRQRYVDC